MQRLIFLVSGILLFAVIAFTQIMGIIEGNSWFGCANQKYFRKLVDYSVSGDKDAFIKALYAGMELGICTVFKDGEKVYITDTSLFRCEVKVRRPGQLIGYWTFMEAVQTK